ncbi:MAG: glutathione synthase [Gammaproteobacteria bacterium]|nr:glutathione synthase [Gammaproteobacteria bacterium]
MRIGFLVNDIGTEKAGVTTQRLAITAVNRDHEVWFLGAGDLAYDVDEKIHGWARSTVGKRYKTTTTYLKELQSPKARSERIAVDDLDILMLRIDPAQDTGRNAWVKSAGIIFGNIALRSGVIVLNDPTALAGALDKMYLQLLPDHIRPGTLVSCDAKEIKAFVEELGGNAVLKGFQGTGAQPVFLVTRNNRGNLNQMVEAISRHGYVIAQEYLPAAEKGSIRLFLINGEPMRYKGRIAAFQWVRTAKGMHSDIHEPGTTEPVTLTDAHFEIAEAIRPRLVQDGMFLASIEIIDNKLIDIDVFRPSGLITAQSYEKANFSEAVIQALERKVDYMSYYRRQFDNVDMATL